MSAPQSFAAWLTAAPDAWIRTLVHTRRDAVRKENASNLRFANALSSRAAVAVGIESLNAQALSALTRAAARTRVEPVVHAEVFGASAEVRAPVIEALLAAGLIWPAAANGADPAAADSFRVQPEAVTLLPTTAAAAKAAPWWAAKVPAIPADPAPESVSRALALNAQAAAVSETLQTLHAVIRLFADSPASVLVSGGVSKRDLQTYAHKLHLDPELAVFIIELARSLRLLGVGGDELDPLWLPSTYTDAFCTQDRAQSFAAAVDAWLRSPVDSTHIVTGKNPAGERVHLLANHTLKSAYAGFPTIRPATVFSRFGTLELLRRLSAEHSAGTPAHGADAASLPAFALPDLLAHARFSHPLVPSFTKDTMRQVLNEAESLGLVCSPLGHMDAFALTPLGWLLTEHLVQAMTPDLAPTHFSAAALSIPPELASEVSELLPELQDTVVIQSDLTAIATGPIEPATETALESLAVVETRGQGTVFRFTAESLKAAFEAGLTPAEVREKIAQISATGIPGPLDFLIDDTASKLHRVRVASARGAIVVDDPDDLDAIIDDPLFIAAKLVRVAPTVALAALSTERLTELLSAHGTQVLSHSANAGPRLAPVPAEAPAAARTTQRLPDAQLAAFTQAVRAPARTPASGDISSVSAALREAISTAQVLDVEFVTGDGQRQRITLQPRVLSAGRVRGRRLSGNTASEVTVTVSRIISARPHVTQAAKTNDRVTEEETE